MAEIRRAQLSESTQRFRPGGDGLAYGDLMQRVNDAQREQAGLTSTNSGMSLNSSDIPGDALGSTSE